MTERNLITPPTQQTVQFPDLGDNVFIKDTVYPITALECRGLIINEWVEIGGERINMHGFLNYCVWFPEQNQWAKRPNLEQLLAEAEPIEAQPELPPVEDGMVRIHIDGQDWARLAAATVPPPKA